MPNASLVANNRRIVVLDRDGVINVDSDDYIKTPDEWRPEPGSLEAICRLKRAGFAVAIATNQSGVARQLFSEQTLAAIHQKMQSALVAVGGEGVQIDCIAYCPHLPTANCACRKPGTAMLDAIRTMTKLSLQSALFVGDSLKDLQAALAYGCSPVLVRTGKGAATEQQLNTLDSIVPVYNNLQQVVDAVLE